jgi:signal transduction histidine kinase
MYELITRKGIENKVQERTAELEESNTALEEANRFKTEMLSIASHDLKNPLGQIIAFAELVEMELDNPEAASAMLRNLQRSASGMLDLVKNILDSASMDLGKIRIVQEPFLLNFLLVSVYETYITDAEKKEQTILLEIESDLILDGDAERLRQVFDNLLSNAVKYSPIRKQIWLRAFSSGDNVRVEIQDEGPGLTEDDKAKLFGFFQRLSAQPTGGESSNGVGLAIVKKIVDLHDGRIWVESEPGQGTNFIVELPTHLIGGRQENK